MKTYITQEKYWHDKAKRGNQRCALYFIAAYSKIFFDQYILKAIYSYTCGDF